MNSRCWTRWRLPPLLPVRTLQCSPPTDAYFDTFWILD